MITPEVTGGRELDQLRRALRKAANRDCTAEMCVVLEQMLDRGMLKYRENNGQPFWSACGAEPMRDQICGVQWNVDRAALSLFIRGLIVLAPERPVDGPGIYWREAVKPH